MPAKRKSGGGGDAKAKAARATASEPIADSASHEDLVKYLKWVEHQFPAEHGVCITDANVGGAEKLCVSSMPEDLGIRPPFAIKVDELSPESTGLLPPLSAFMIKGLAEKLALATVQHTENRVRSDLKAVKAYVDDLNHWGALDVKFLQGRFERGKAWCHKYMSGHHRYVATELSSAHADLLQWQRGEHGGEGLTIMVMDLSLWPSSLLCVSNIHKEFAFSRSKAAMCGVLGPVQRARVVELVSEDADKPPSPPARAL
ncbi:Uncharacterized protein SCF082_LOCUS8393 [Durusdinium trenchii]|uniref:Uncharacterized protein n=1 Tax=Durusdinium trenchii TaxID=1381693 RepID=A0ABP0IQS6_9DINO